MRFVRAVLALSAALAIGASSLAHAQVPAAPVDRPAQPAAVINAPPGYLTTNSYARDSMLREVAPAPARDGVVSAQPPTAAPTLVAWRKELGPYSPVPPTAAETPSIPPCPTCEAAPKVGFYGFLAYDAFRGIADGSWENNGIVKGLNSGFRLGSFSDLTGVAFQLGGSVGVFDWSGTEYRTRNTSQAQVQGFVTYGLFRRPNERSRWSGALVQDWMINSTYGVFGENPTLSQCRAQVGYALNAWNELGMWGSWRGHTDLRDVPGFGTTRWRAVNQLNVFWHHKWERRGADSTFWFGVPDRTSLSSNGSLGDYIVGASANVPLNERVALYTMLSYMHPSASPGPAASLEEFWNYSIGLAFYPGRRARSETVAGQCWMPLMPVANNGYFLVDTNNTF